MILFLIYFTTLAENFTSQETQDNQDDESAMSDYRFSIATLKNVREQRSDDETLQKVSFQIILNLMKINKIEHLHYESGEKIYESRYRETLKEIIKEMDYYVGNFKDNNEISLRLSRAKAFIELGDLMRAEVDINYVINNNKNTKIDEKSEKNIADAIIMLSEIQNKRNLHTKALETILSLKNLSIYPNDLFLEKIATSYYYIGNKTEALQKSIEALQFYRRTHPLIDDTKLIKKTIQYFIEIHQGDVYNFITSLNPDKKNVESIYIYTLNVLRVKNDENAVQSLKRKTLPGPYQELAWSFLDYEIVHRKFNDARMTIKYIDSKNAINKLHSVIDPFYKEVLKHIKNNSVGKNDIEIYVLIELLALDKNTDHYQEQAKLYVTIRRYDLAFKTIGDYIHNNSQDKNDAFLFQSEMIANFFQDKNIITKKVHIRSISDTNVIKLAPADASIARTWIDNMKIARSFYEKNNTNTFARLQFMAAHFLYATGHVQDALTIFKYCYDAFHDTEAASIIIDTLFTSQYFEECIEKSNIYLNEEKKRQQKDFKFIAHIEEALSAISDKIFEKLYQEKKYAQIIDKISKEKKPISSNKAIISANAALGLNDKKSAIIFFQQAGPLLGENKILYNMIQGALADESYEIRQALTHYLELEKISSHDDVRKKILLYAWILHDSTLDEILKIPSFCQTIQNECKKYQTWNRFYNKRSSPFLTGKTLPETQFIELLISIRNSSEKIDLLTALSQYWPSLGAMQQLAILSNLFEIIDESMKFIIDDIREKSPLTLNPKSIKKRITLLDKFERMKETLDTLPFKKIKIFVLMAKKEIYQDFADDILAITKYRKLQEDISSLLTNKSKIYTKEAKIAAFEIDQLIKERPHALDLIKITENDPKKIRMLHEKETLFIKLIKNIKEEAESYLKESNSDPLIHLFFSSFQKTSRERYYFFDQLRIKKIDGEMILYGILLLESAPAEGLEVLSSHELTLPAELSSLIEKSLNANSQ